MEIKIDENIKENIYKLIKNSKREIVLLLDGINTKGKFEILNIIPLKNTARSNVDFIVEEDEYNLAKDKIIHNLIGVFHSHKSTLNLSERDIIELKNSNLIWLIGIIQNDKLMLSGYLCKKGKILNLKFN